jgi:hypothetical protein
MLEELDCKPLSHEDFAEILEQKYHEGIRAVQMHRNDYACIRGKELDLCLDGDQIRKGIMGTIRDVTLLVLRDSSLPEGMVDYLDQVAYQRFMNAN